ncbi:MAG: cation:proton antiporter [Candidatus Promineifilaceae bacterium]
MELSIEKIEILLLIAAIVAMVARRLKIPYTIALVLAGVVLAISPITPEVNLSKELIFTIFLPPLIYEAALYIRWQELRRDFPVIITFATVGVLLSAGITAAGMHFFVNWQWESAILFGVLIAATDPVSVIATFKEAGVHGRLRLLVEAESLFNDSTAAVAFVIALAFATGEPVTFSGTLLTLVTMVFGGILCGALVAGGALLLAGRTDDHLIEITLTTIAAYGSFLLAEHFHLSGVLASLTAGLLTGNIGSLGSISDKGREAVESFWEYVAFVVNSLIFILIGIREAHQDFFSLLIPILIAIIIVIIGRAAAIYPISILFSRSVLQIKKSRQHILFWGGLRGALALALALGLPPEIPRRDEIVTIAFGVVGFSVIVQGLTITPLLRKFNEISVPSSETNEH